jgi:SAM-dependent methyltransferase
MGRRGLSVEDDERWVFNRLAEAYAHRPAYPELLVERLVVLASGGRAAELGAGLGHLAVPLAARGVPVAAVEPARRMFQALDARRAAGVEAVHAAAEDTGLSAGTFALVVLADALQWVDPERTGREAARLLSLGGACAVVEARWGGTPFVDGILARAAELNPKLRRATGGALRQLVTLAVGRRALWTERFVDEQELSAAAIDPVVRSLSWVGPALSPAVVDGLVQDAQRLAVKHGARWRRELLLTWARREGATP